jgi:peptidyl-prolyl cis-trans isomerase B (cyclophilin B)
MVAERSARSNTLRAPLRLAGHRARIGAPRGRCRAGGPIVQGRDAERDTHMTRRPKIHMQTNYGTIVLELFPDKAPKTVTNFLQYVKDSFYDNTLFHRVIDNFVVQGGGFGPGMTQKVSHPPIENEANNGLRNERGTIAMARATDPHSASSQFFINVVDNDFLNYTAPTPAGWGYCVFGRVVDGMHVVDQIKGVPTGSRLGFRDVPLTDVIVEKVQLIEE